MFEKSHILILESETLSRESRVTESAQRLSVKSLLIGKYTYVYNLSTLIYSLWWRKKKVIY